MDGPLIEKISSKKELLTLMGLLGFAAAACTGDIVEPIKPTPAPTITDISSELEPTPSPAENVQIILDDLAKKGIEYNNFLLEEEQNNPKEIELALNELLGLEHDNELELKEGDIIIATASYIEKDGVTNGETIALMLKQEGAEEPTWIIFYNPETDDYEGLDIKSQTPEKLAEIDKNLPQITLTPPPTSEPTSTEAPTPTTEPTPEPTPTPQPIEWDFAQELPKIHSGNATFEATDESGTIKFIHEERDYFISINKPTGAIIDIRGNEVVDGKLEAEFYRSEHPKITYVDENNEVLGWYDLEANEWIKRYETLFIRDTYEPLPEIPHIENSLGFEYLEKGAEYDPMAHYITFSGRVKRVWTERVKKTTDFAPAALAPELINTADFPTLTWMTINYGNNENNLVDVLVYTNEEYQFNSWWPQLIQISQGASNYSRFVPPDIYYSNQEIFEALQKSSFVQIKVALCKKKYSPSNQSGKTLADLTMRYPMPRQEYLERHHFEDQRGFIRTLVNEHLQEPGVQELDNSLSDFESVEKNIPFGYASLWIFTPKN